MCTFTDDERDTDARASSTVCCVSIRIYLSTRMQPRFGALKALKALTSTALSPLTNSKLAPSHTRIYLWNRGEMQDDVVVGH